MAVILHVAVKVHLHAVGVAAQVVACEVDKHDVLGVLLRVGQQGFGQFPVGLFISAAARSSRYRVDVGVVSFNAAVCLGRGAEYAERTEVEIKQIWRRIDAPQRAVQVEVVACVTLFETARHYDLENIAAPAMFYALPYVLAVLLVGKRACCPAHGVKVVCPEVIVVYPVCYAFDVGMLVVTVEGYEFHFVAESLEHNYIPVKDVQKVGRVVAAGRAVLYFNVVGVPYHVERCKPVQPAAFCILALYAEVRYEIAYCLFNAVFLAVEL